eukprot:COSAG04_NODE_9426_length_865_cov_2.293734_1_plen_126_part_10
MAAASIAAAAATAAICACSGRRCQESALQVVDATARGVPPPGRLVRTLTPPSLIRIRPANSDDDARFIVDTLLEAGRDVSADASPFGLGALMESPLFQQRQLDSSLRKVEKTAAQRAVDARANRAH